MKKSNLDEMQEQKLLKIEHTCCWLAYWGLLLAIVIQLVYTRSMREVIGESIVFFILCGYMMFSTLRHGIWDRRLKPNLKTNLIGSLIAGVFLAVFSYFRFGHQVTDPNRLFLICLLSGLFVFLLCFVTLSVTAAIHKKRREKLDKE